MSSFLSDLGEAAGTRSSQIMLFGEFQQLRVNRQLGPQLSLSLLCMRNILVSLPGAI